jgi:hypothetical protein
MGAGDRLRRLESVVAEQQRVITALLAERSSVPAATRAADALPPARADTQEPSSRMGRRDVLRRALLAGAAVAGSAVLATAEAGPAAAGTPQLLGNTQTNVELTTVLFADSTTPVTDYQQGVFVVTDTPFAAMGYTLTDRGAVTGYGGQLEVGVGVSGFGSRTGVVGNSTNGIGGSFHGASGVFAQGDSGPALVAASYSSTPAMIAYGATDLQGKAHVHGAAQFDDTTTFHRSGIAVVRGTKSKPADSVAVHPGPLTAHSMVLATIQQAVGSVGVSGVVLVPSTGTFTIRLTAKVRTPVRVAWFVLS